MNKMPYVKLVSWHTTHHLTNMLFIYFNRKLSRLLFLTLLFSFDFSYCQKEKIAVSHNFDNIAAIISHQDILSLRVNKAKVMCYKYFGEVDPSRLCFEWSLYRIGQEVDNITEPAKATDVSFFERVNATLLNIIIEDAGIGLDHLRPGVKTINELFELTSESGSSVLVYLAFHIASLKGFLLLNHSVI